MKCLVCDRELTALDNFLCGIHQILFDANERHRKKEEIK